MQVPSSKQENDLKTNINPFTTNVPLLYPLKTENLRFSDVFRGIVVEHWLKMG